jgi:hypothetical protein
VDVTSLTSTQYDVKVSLFNGYQFVATGLPSFVFDLSNAPTILAENTLTPGWNFMGTAPGLVHDDGLGTFEYGFTCAICSNGGSNPQPGPLEFTITVPEGTTFVSNGNAFFGVDVAGPNGNTGAVGAPSLSSGTPEPTTVVETAIGFGLLLFSLSNRWRKAR